ncbi:hypothetical protein V8F33_011668 [Rhypophila sp. PSN 637]
MPPSTRQATRRAAARAEEVKSEVEERARAAPSVNAKVEDVDDEGADDDDAQSRNVSPDLKEDDVDDERADDDDSQSGFMSPDFRDEDVDKEADDDDAQSRASSVNIKAEDMQAQESDDDDAQSQDMTPEFKEEDVDDGGSDDDAQSRAVAPELKEESHYFVKDEIKEEPGVPRVKRRASATPDRKANNKRRRASLPGNTPWNQQIVAVPARRDPNGHPHSYHHPLLLNNLTARQDLLAWFDSVTSNRAMPWRKPWINPDLYPDRSPLLRQMLEKRAYEVWISEIMLQQTRVATVIDYWNRWMDRWPTIQDLAAADRQEVLDAWSGLGYYNRATRIHQAAKEVCKSFGGLIPNDVRVLENNMAGVGRYTAGAIAAIVYGKPAALVDGNVMRVMSRQMGMFGETQKPNSGLSYEIWNAAEELAEQVVRDEIRGIELVDAEEEEDKLGEEDGDVKEEEREEKPNNRRIFMMRNGLPLSDKPGKLGQALMELGSTICTPKPDCAACPITDTCRAYSEGFALALHSEDISGPGTDPRDYRAPAPKPRRQVLHDIEDFCVACDEGQEQEAGICADGNTNVKYREINPYRTTSILTPNHEGTIVHSARAFAIINHHTAKYPHKPARKTLKQQESQVFALRRVSDGRYFVQRRPPKGLLPNMWELPSTTFDATPFTGRSRHPARKTTEPDPEGTTENVERELLDQIINNSDLLISPRPEPVWVDYGDETPDITRRWDEAGGPPRITHVGELGIIPWTFSHIKMFMHVQFFELDDTHPETQRHHHWAMYGRTQRWLTPAQVDEVTMGTGMRRCWEMVKRTEEELLGAAE